MKVVVATLPVHFGAVPPEPTVIGPVGQVAGGATTGPPATHEPLTQAFPVAQVVPRAPHATLLEAISTQAPLQGVRPVRHVDEHAPEEQNVPLAHFAPQPPQFEGSATVEMQAPPHKDW